MQNTTTAQAGHNAGSHSANLNDQLIDEPVSELAPGEWEDELGRIWHEKLQPRPHTQRRPDQAVIEDEFELAALEALNALPTEAPALKLLKVPANASRYDKSFSAARNTRAEFTQAMQIFGPADARTIALSSALAEAEARFEREKKRATDDTARRQDAIDAWRMTDDGREQYNERRRIQRRKVRATPNADLAGLTADEKAEHVRKRERQKKAAQRAKAKAAKMAVVV